MASPQAICAALAAWQGIGGEWTEDEMQRMSDALDAPSVQDALAAWFGEASVSESRMAYSYRMYRARQAAAEVE